MAIQLCNHNLLPFVLNGYSFTCAATILSPFLFVVTLQFFRQLVQLCRHNWPTSSWLFHKCIQDIILAAVYYFIFRVKFLLSRLYKPFLPFLPIITYLRQGNLQMASKRSIVAHSRSTSQLEHRADPPSHVPSPDLGGTRAAQHKQRNARRGAGCIDSDGPSPPGAGASAPYSKLARLPRPESELP